MSDTEDEIKRQIEDLSHPERSRGTASHQKSKSRWDPRSSSPDGQAGLG